MKKEQDSKMDYKKINDAFHSSNWWGLDRSKNKWFSKYVKAKVFKKFIADVKTKGVIYDAGGGVGNWGSYSGKEFKKVVVSDISKVALSKIPEKNIVKINCSVMENKMPANSVDCILLIDVFEHIDEEDLGQMLTDLRRILKKDGRLIICSSLYGWGWGMVLQRIFNPKKKLLKDEHLEGHVNRLSFKEYREILKENGLEIDDYYFYSIIFQQMTDGLKNNFAKLASIVLGKKKDDAKAGREGQSIKEDMRKKEDKTIVKIPLTFLSWVSYLDILLFGKLVKGNTIYLSVKKI